MSESKEIEIPEAHREILAKNHIAVLTTLRQKDGLPSTNPVGYVWDGECVRISTIKDRVKYRSLVADPRVAFCVVDADDHMVYVELRGYATIEEDPDQSFLRHTFVHAGMEPPEAIDPPGTERVIVRIHPQQSSSPTLYGGRFHQS